MQNIRRAKSIEATVLSELAASSEAYWGYDEEYMKKFRNIYSISEEFIEKNPTYILEDDKEIIGFYSLVFVDKKTELEHFFIKSEYIGRGYGKVLWHELIKFCKGVNINNFYIVTSPQAKEFYIKMGSVFLEETESLLRVGRMIPRLIYYLD